MIGATQLRMKGMDRKSVAKRQKSERWLQVQGTRSGPMAHRVARYQIYPQLTGVFF